MKKIAYLYVFNTLADWEPGLIIAELNRGRFFKDKRLKYEVRTAGLSKAPVVTMGGVRILPDLALDELSTSEAGVLILPGGESWLEPLHNALLPRVKEFLAAKIPVAGICGATAWLAGHGFLDNCSHTSNSLDYLKTTCPDYKGEMHYTNEPAALDGDIITASGLAPLEFAHLILKRLDVFTHDSLEAWFKLLRTREVKYYIDLLNSLPQ